MAGPLTSYVIISGWATTNLLMISQSGTLEIIKLSSGFMERIFFHCTGIRKLRFDRGADVRCLARKEESSDTFGLSNQRRARGRFEDSKEQESQRDLTEG